MGVLLVISTVAYQNMVNLQKSQESITRSYQLTSELNKLYSRLTESRASLLNYLLTEDGSSLERFEDSRSKIQTTIRRLQTYAQSSPEQIERLDDLQWSINAALYSIEDVLAIEHSTDGSSEAILRALEDNRVLVRSVRVIVREMTKAEEAHIRENRLKQIKESSFSPFSAFLLILFSLLALVLFYYRINEDFERLKRANRELKSTNEELNSFNHVTSHDLQEPLRKIETFISRLEHSEKENLSDKGKEYLGKISHSTGRMRSLIQDLLLFSQISSSERKREFVSLTTLIEEAKQELEDELSARNGKVIISGTLPEISCIPFQIRQLFINLLSNSIKYIAEGKNPTVEITASLRDLTEGEMPSLTEKHYWKISVKDNGIGFEQQYADKIFDLFERLHGNKEYSGSGIGLAICKKIAENHLGGIRAEGVPGEGATFYIYLPS